MWKEGLRDPPGICSSSSSELSGLVFFIFHLSLLLVYLRLGLGGPAFSRNLFTCRPDSLLPVHIMQVIAARGNRSLKLKLAQPKMLHTFGDISSLALVLPLDKLRLRGRQWRGGGILGFLVAVQITANAQALPHRDGAQLDHSRFMLLQHQQCRSILAQAFIFSGRYAKSGLSKSRFCSTSFADGY